LDGDEEECGTIDESACFVAGRGEMNKDDHVYKTVELTGTSRSTFEAAVKSAIRTASRTLRHLRWFEVVEVRGEI
jgi:flavin-binding protein dodecin